jgi:methylmalonyl-CoA mutase N-terminal domain/subunit
VRVGLRTEQIIAHEHGLTDTIDPLAGSYFVETLTSEIEAQILAALDECEQAGGALGVIERGLGRRWMTEGAVRRQRATDSGDRPWVTVNLWPQQPDVVSTAFRVNPEYIDRQLERLNRVKATRDERRVADALGAVDAACRADENALPATIAAVRAYATVGEICDRWRAHYGAFTPSVDF